MLVSVSSTDTTQCSLTSGGRQWHSSERA